MRDSSAATTGDNTASTQRRILYFVTEDWYFASHRLPVALAAQAKGYEIHVATRVGKWGNRLESLGFTVHPTEIHRTSTNPFRDIALIRSLTDVYRAVSPALAHHVALKPVLYGTLAARLAGVPHVINAMAGLGYVFSSTERHARLLRSPVGTSLRWAMNWDRSDTIVQNDDDAKTLIGLGVLPQKINVIRGSGVDVDTFKPSKRSLGPPIVALSARLTREKGVYDFLAAARTFRREGSAARFALIGVPDPKNPSSVTETELQHWVTAGDVEWWGWSDDMPATWNQVDIACLPSTYGEGLPKSLLEAAACGLLIVTTDSPGCRDTVLHGVNGFIVQPGAQSQLVDALRLLINNPSLRTSQGAAGRDLVKTRFAQEIVIRQTISLYDDRTGAKR